MRIARRFTQAGKDVYDSIEFRRTSSEIRNPDGSLVFQAEDIEVPAAWSQVASDILAQKYFRKRGVPLAKRRIEENSVPSWLWRSEPDSEKLQDLPEDERATGETSAKQVFDRLAGTDRIRLALEDGVAVADLLASWREPLAQFEALRREYLLYD